LSGVTQVVCFTVEGLLGLSLDDGKPLWRVPLKTSYGRNCTTPLIVDDWVVAGSYRAGLIGVKVANDAAGLKAERRWENKSAAMNFSSPVAVGRHVWARSNEKYSLPGDRDWPDRMVERRLHHKLSRCCLRLISRRGKKHSGVHRWWRVGAPGGRPCPMPRARADASLRPELV